MTRAVPEWIADHDDQAVPRLVKARTIITEEDVLARVQTEANTGCWLWDAGGEAAGYGFWPTPGRGKRRAHRVSFEACVGPIPKGMVVCHRCDTPACINPQHLFLGTQAQNLQDMWRKGRGKRLPVARGEHNHQAKLTRAQVDAILADPRGHATVARDYGVTRQAIFLIRKGVSWRGDHALCS